MPLAPHARLKVVKKPRAIFRRLNVNHAAPEERGRAGAQEEK
jgi:hypothetical protein